MVQFILNQWRSRRTCPLTMEEINARLADDATLTAEERLSLINARVALIPTDPRWTVPPPQGLRREDPPAEVPMQPIHPPADAPLPEPDQEPIGEVPPPPPAPAPRAHRRRGRMLLKFPHRDVVHFEGCDYLQHGTYRPIVLGRLCLVCGGQ